VLELKNNKFYVGKSNNVEQRFQQHCYGSGSEWTKLHKPVKIIKTFNISSPYQEDEEVKKLMSVHGIDNVRGGSYSQIELLDWQIKALDSEIKSACDACFTCGIPGHYANECPDYSIEELETIIDNLQGAIHYLQHTKTDFCISAINVSSMINSTCTNQDLRKLLIGELKQHIVCPVCKSSGERKIGKDSKQPGLKCRECWTIYNATINIVYKPSIQFIEKIPPENTIKNGMFVTTNTNNKVNLYTSYINAKKLETKYNNVIQKYHIKLSSDNAVITKLNNILEIMYHKLALKY
jgi:hypothetical protein